MVLVVILLIVSLPLTQSACVLIVLVTLQAATSTQAINTTKTKNNRFICAKIRRKGTAFYRGVQIGRTFCSFFTFFKF